MYFGVYSKDGSKIYDNNKIKTMREKNGSTVIMFLCYTWIGLHMNYLKTDHDKLKFINPNINAHTKYSYMSTMEIKWNCKLYSV